jgi:hypothetical protein
MDLLTITPTMFLTYDVWGLIGFWSVGIMGVITLLVKLGCAISVRRAK